jgi:hypothetical protein
MTLAVAKVTSHQIVIVSDTRTGDPRQQREIGTLKDGLLKTTFISNDVAVAFTGSTDIAQETVRRILTQGDGDLGFKFVLNFFAGSTVDNENEYLVGFAGPKRLFHVARGQTKEQRAAWIGDKAAFERFQSGAAVTPSHEFWRATIIGPNVFDQKFVIDQIGHFQGVIEDSKITTVGDFFTVAVSNGGRFRFISIATLYFDTEGRILGPNGNAILPSTGENRDYRFTTWVPRQQHLAVAAFVFPEVKRAFVFHPRNQGFSDECLVFDGLTGDLLADEIERKIGIRFEVIELRHT